MHVNAKRTRQEQVRLRSGFRNRNCNLNVPPLCRSLLTLITNDCRIFLSPWYSTLLLDLNSIVFGIQKELEPFVLYTTSSRRSQSTEAKERSRGRNIHNHIINIFWHSGVYIRDGRFHVLGSAPGETQALQHGLGSGTTIFDYQGCSDSTSKGNKVSTLCA